MECPDIILIEDDDGGYIKAKHIDTVEDADEQEVEVYKKVEYYHDFDSAMRDI